MSSHGTYIKERIVTYDINIIIGLIWRRRFLEWTWMAIIWGAEWEKCSNPWCTKHNSIHPSVLPQSVVSTHRTFLLSCPQGPQVWRWRPFLAIVWVEMTCLRWGVLFSSDLVNGVYVYAYIRCTAPDHTFVWLWVGLLLLKKLVFSHFAHFVNFHLVNVDKVRIDKVGSWQSENWYKVHFIKRCCLINYELVVCNTDNVSVYNLFITKYTSWKFQTLVYINVLLECHVNPLVTHITNVVIRPQ